MNHQSTIDSTDWNLIRMIDGETTRFKVSLSHPASSPFAFLVCNFVLKLQEAIKNARDCTIKPDREGMIRVMFKLWQLGQPGSVLKKYWT